ncbi:MAG: cation:proton antiporter [Gaiellales bacterium]|nr:MAG: cation:proton antiporter [Gaiellales bacterium]
METHTFFLVLLAVLLSARLFGELTARAGVPSVIGELFAGIVLGPSLLGWVEPVEAIRLLAEIGIILLLFEVGLETDVARLVRTGFESIVVAAAGAILPMAFGFGASYFIFSQSMLTSLFVGGTLTATSIGVTVRILADLGKGQTREARIVLGAAVLDDIVGVVLLAFLFEFSTHGGVSLINTGRVLLFIAVFMVLAPVAARFIASTIKRYEPSSRTGGLIPTTVVSLVLLFAWLAHAIGVPELLGGFAAGLALSRRFFLPMGIAMHTDDDFVERAELQMRPIIQLFTPIFFVVVGLSLDFRSIDLTSSFVWSFSLVLLLLAFAGKMLGAFIIRESKRVSLIIGAAMVPRGEVGLIFAELGLSSAVFNDETYAVLVIVIAITTVFPAFVLKRLYY